MDANEQSSRPSPIDSDAVRDAARDKAAAARLTFDHGYGDSAEAMSQLAEAFHVLQDAPGVRPWTPAKLAAWAYADGRTRGTMHAAVFVLNVWSGEMIIHKIGHDPWESFDFHDAMSRWDWGCRGAFLGWAQHPWWP